MNGLQTRPGNTPPILYHAGINPIPILVLTIREAGLIFYQAETNPPWLTAFAFPPSPRGKL